MNENNDIEGFAPWLVLILTLVGGGLRVFILANKGLWWDETLSIWIANHSIADMLRWLVNIGQHPPLYYLMLHAWIKINAGTYVTARMFSVLFGTVTIPVMYLIGKRMSGVVMGLAAAMFMAFSPFNIRFAQETRLYTFLTFNAAVAIYALVILLSDARSSQPFGRQIRDYLRAWRAPRQAEPDTQSEFTYREMARKQTGWQAWLARHRPLPIQMIETDLAWIGFVVFSAATMLSHNTGVLFPIAANVFVFGWMLFRRLTTSISETPFQAPALGNWVRAQVAIFLLWSPWMVGFIKQASRANQEISIPAPSWDVVTTTIRSFLNDLALGQTSQAMLMWVLYGLVLFLGMVYYRKNLARFLFLAALLTIPFLGELIVSLRQPIFSDRTLIWTTIPLFLLLAAGIVQLRFRILMIVVLGILAANNIFSTGDYFRFVQKGDWNNPAGFIANFVQKDDLILFNATWSQVPFDYFFVPYEQRYLLQVEKHGVPADLFESGTWQPKMTDGDLPRLETLLSGHQRVWLVYSHNEEADPQGLIPQALTGQLKLLYVRDFNDVQVQFYGSQ